MKAGQWIEPASGKELSHEAVIATASRAGVVLLGEQHDKAAQHRWQLHVLAALRALRSDLVCGFEMFPARLDPVLARWVAGEFAAEEAFLEAAEWGKVWGFPAELYLPIFRFCRQFRVPMHGLNCRRTLVSEVGKLGWEGVAEDDRDGLTPARAATADYRRYLFEITGGGSPSRKAQSPDDPAFDRFVRAQQVWDRSFACRIAGLREGATPPLVAGIIGRGHLEFGHGTPAQLADLAVGPVVVLLPHVRDTEPAAGLADAVFCLDADEG
ncbi:ChaN family lipoprotein [Roseibium sp. CAU 1637]|uniref:ChaN family lipoprotein n=1 Tax=Roseibium limicola TaxID=2816037 RepID=A0A939J7M4_9HYPH|nr:ChaN family lipoprotein [Roseibium limicola]MBO0343959.1 ChaN family lipoprotein [Roseibium limicola]